MAIIEVRTDDGRVVWTLNVTAAPKPGAKGDWWKVTAALKTALEMEGN